MANGPYGRRSRRGATSRLNLILSLILIVIVIAIVAVLVLSSRGDEQAPASTPTAQAGATPTAPLGAATPTAGGAQETPGLAATAPTGTAEQPTPTVEPTPTPLVGDFGDLPAADMPSGNSAGRALTLDYRLDLSLQAVPTQADVYALEHHAWTLDDAQALAQSLGITGEVVDQGGGSFRANGGGSLYISGDLVRYVADPGATPTAGALPGDDALVEAARAWLLQHGLVGADAGPGSVVLRDEEAGRAIVLIKPVEPDPILSAVPAASVTLSGDGEVVQADIRWPQSLRRSTYGLRPAEELWNEIRTGRGYVELDPAALPSPAGPLNGSATLTSVSMAYTIAGTPASQQFLVPLVVFSGQAQIEGAAQPIPIKVYVPAVSAQATPRG